MVRTLRNLSRLFRIARVLARHDALFALERLPVGGVVATLARMLYRRLETGRPGERLARALADLGPTFIKFGQALSTRPDLLGEDVARDLTALQDKLPPFPFGETRTLIEAEFDRPLESLYRSFEHTPVAAASIAQVHFAETTEGQSVAVKVLRPGVEQAFRRDIDLLYWLAELVEWTRPRLRRLRPVASVATFEESVNIEMDLRFEAAAAAEMADNFVGDATFRIPSIDWQRTGQQVMTQERISGIPLDERSQILAAGLDPVAVITHAANAFFKMVFQDGFFHADLHPGNLFVQRDGVIVAVDFGIVGRVDHGTRRVLGEMLLGFLTKNYRRVAEVHFEAGWIPADKSIDAFTQAARSIAEPIFGRPIQDISIARLLGQLFAVTETFSMETQPQLLLLQKSMLLAEGIGRTLAPDINMWELAHPLIEKWMRANLGPEAKIKRALLSTTQSLEKIPGILAQAERAASMMSSEGLKLHPDTVAAMGQRSKASGLFQRWLPWALVIALLVLVLIK